MANPTPTSKTDRAFKCVLLVAMAWMAGCLVMMMCSVSMVPADVTNIRALINFPVGIVTLEVARQMLRTLLNKTPYEGQAHG